MDRNSSQQPSQGTSAGEDRIDERLLDDQQDGRQNILDAASDAFIEDQQDPDHPTRVKRRHDVEDPSHSRGSRAQGPGEGDFNQQK